jgi:hypothetical protein
VEAKGWLVSAMLTLLLLLAHSPAHARKVDRVICDGPCTIVDEVPLKLNGGTYVLVRAQNHDNDQIWLVKRVKRVQAGEWLVTFPATGTHSVTPEGQLTVTTAASSVVMQLAPFQILSATAKNDETPWTWTSDGGMLTGARCDGSDAPAIPFAPSGEGPIGACGRVYDGPAGRLKVMRRGNTLVVQADHFGSVFVDVGFGCGDTEPIDLAVQAGEVVSVDIPEGLFVRGVSLSHQGEHPLAEEVPQLVTDSGPRARTLQAPRLSAYQCVEGEVVWDDPTGAILGDLTRK